MNDETFSNMIGSFAWGIRVEPGNPYRYPATPRQLLINEVWLTDQSAATTQDTEVYATVGDRDDKRRACQISAKATWKGNKSQSPGDKIDEEIEAELDKETENNNDKMKLDDMGSRVLDSSKDKVNVDDEAKGKEDSLNMPVPYLAEVETTKEDRATAPSSEGLNLERESFLASAPLPLIELEGEKKREEQTNKDDMKKKSNGIGGCKGLSIRDRWNKYLDFAEICIENKWERRKRLRKDVLPVTFFGEKKRNGGKREKHESIESEFDDDVDIDGE